MVGQWSISASPHRKWWRSSKCDGVNMLSSETEIVALSTQRYSEHMGCCLFISIYYLQFPFNKRTEKRELIQQFRLLVYYKEKKNSKTKISVEYFTCKLLEDTYKQRSKEGRDTRRHGWLYPSNSDNCASICREIGSLSQTWWCELWPRLEHVRRIPELQHGGFSGLCPPPQHFTEFQGELVSVAGSGSGSSWLLISPRAEHPQRNTLHMPYAVAVLCIYISLVTKYTFIIPELENSKP